MSQTSVPKKNARPPRIRSKLEFLEADDPGKALLDFFFSLGAKARSPHQETGVRSLPLILISQLPRSGGSLASQLLDGHPELLAYPWEMKIGYPYKGRWPTLDLSNTPEHLFATLFHTEFAYFARGAIARAARRAQAEASEVRLNAICSPDACGRWRPAKRLARFDPCRRSGEIDRALASPVISIISIG